MSNNGVKQLSYYANQLRLKIDLHHWKIDFQSSKIDKVIKWVKMWFGKWNA